MKYFRTFCRMAILTVFALVITLPYFPVNSGQEKAKDSDSSVIKGTRLSAELVDDDLFNLGDTIAIKLKLENTGKSPVYMHKQLGFGAGGFRITMVMRTMIGFLRNSSENRFPLRRSAKRICK